MNQQETASRPESSSPTQSQVYENLRRIGELEDKKTSIQAEIERRTAELQAAIDYVDKDSLLYAMLSSALGGSAGGKRSAKRSPKVSRTTKKTASRKTSRKKPRKKKRR